MIQSKLTMNEIAKKVQPLAKKYRVANVYLFGSYARGEATAESDFDFLITRSGSLLRGMDFYAFRSELEEIFGEDKVDLLTEEGLDFYRSPKEQRFREAVMKERRKLL